MDSGSEQSGAPGRLRIPAWRFSAVVVVGGTLLAACGGKDPVGSPPGTADALEMFTEPPASVATRALLTPAPVIQVVDVNGDPVDTAGIVVTASLQSGGGTLTGTSTATTDGNGQATFGNLQIQGLVGNRVMQFTAPSLTSTQSGQVQLTAGAASTIAANSATNQSGTVSQAVTTKPSVTVTDLDGNGVSGVSITFAVTAGGGSLTGGTPATAAGGTATVGSWTLGAAVGTNTMTATSAGLSGSPVFNATGNAVVSAFNIELQFINTPTVTQQAAFTGAAARWSQAIIGDVGPLNPGVVDVQPCGAPAGTTVSGTINDVRIVVELTPIDGSGKILGAAGPCFLRSGGRQLPVIGYMKFDTADLATIEASGDLQDVILHEMGHVLGYGTLWEPPSPNNLLTTGGTINGSTLGFQGPNAVDAFTGSNGGGGSAVPVHDGNQGGTSRSHWQEPIFLSEVMTGIITGNVHPLSLTSIQSMADLGYTVNPAAADAFNLATQPTLRAGEAEGPVYDLQNDVIRVSYRYLDVTTGRVVSGPKH